MNRKEYELLFKINTPEEIEKKENNIKSHKKKYSKYKVKKILINDNKNNFKNIAFKLLFVIIVIYEIVTRNK